MRLKNIAQLTLVVLLTSLFACSDESSSNRSETVPQEDTVNTAEIDFTEFDCTQGEPVIVNGEDICQSEPVNLGVIGADSIDFGIVDN